MKKALLVVFAMMSVLSASALNELVSKMTANFPEGDFYTVREALPMIRSSVEKDGYAAFSEMDLAFCNYYEALTAQFLMENIDGKEEKLAFNRRVLGDDHYMTLTMQTIYEKFTEPAWTTSQAALQAIEDEVGQESWQYAAMVYRQTEILAEHGKIKEALKLAEKCQKSYTGTSMENHWLNGCLHIIQSVLYSNLQRWDDMVPGYQASSDIFVKINKDIMEDKINPLAVCGNAHLGYYITTTSRAFGFNKESIEGSEGMMKHLEALGMMETGLGNAYRSNVAIAYYKEKNYKKSRKMMTEYLSYLEKKGEKGSPMYNYIDGLLKQTPK